MPAGLEPHVSPAGRFAIIADDGLLITAAAAMSDDDGLLIIDAAAGLFINFPADAFVYSAPCAVAKFFRIWSSSASV